MSATATTLVHFSFRFVASTVLHDVFTSTSEELTTKPFSKCLELLNLSLVWIIFDAPIIGNSSTYPAGNRMFEAEKLSMAGRRG